MTSRFLPVRIRLVRSPRRRSPSGAAARGLLAALACLVAAAFPAAPAAAQSGGVWQVGAPMPAAREGASAGVINGILYVAGGESANPYLTTVEGYSPASNAWTAQHSMPAGLTNAAFGVIGGRLYLAGGYGASGVSATLTAYDPSNDTWATLSPMPTGREGPSAGVIGSKLYVAGGSATGTEAGRIGALEAYNTSSGLWETTIFGGLALVPMPTPRMFGGAGVIDGILYVVGGTGDSPALNVLEAYDPAANTWSTRAPMPTARKGLAVAVANGVLYAVGGLTASGSPVKTVEAYNPAADSWTAMASMPTARGAMPAAVLNGQIYVAGGSDGASPLATLEAFAPPATSSLVASVNVFNSIVSVSVSTGGPTATVTLGNCKERNGTVAHPGLPIPNGTCDSTMTVTNTSNVTAKISAMGSDAVPSGGGKHWTLCGTPASPCTGTGGAPGLDQFILRLGGTPPGFALGTSAQCDTVLDTGTGCPGVAPNAFVSENLYVTGPESSTDLSGSFKITVSWIAVAA